MWSIWLTSLCSVPLLATQSSLAPVSPQEFAARRAALARAIQEGLLYVEGAAETELEIRFLQDDDFYYLTGVETQDAAFYLVAERGKVTEEGLFLPPKDPSWELWNGFRLSPGEEAEKATGIKESFPNSRRKEVLGQALQGVRKVFTPSKKKGKREKAVPDSALVRDLLEGKSAQVEGVRNALDHLQVRKTPAEVARVEEAVRITERGFEAAAAYLRPGGYEYELMGALEGAFLRHGAQTSAFPSVVGSGPNACRLHYQANRRQMLAGELVVMDIGAKYEHYCADVTRTFPVSGKFSPRQAEIYGLVLGAQSRAMEAARPGVKISDVHQAAWKYLEEKKQAQNFWHGTSHFVGLKVHDTPTSNGEELEPGMILTVEPGIYLPEENLGVRIEDDLLITPEGFRHLSVGVPREIAEVEAWIQRFRQGKQ